MNLKYDDDRQGAPFQNNVDSVRYIITSKNIQPKVSTLKRIKEQQDHEKTMDPKCKVRAVKPDPFKLRRLVTQNKVRNLVKNFITKMKRLNIYQNPIDVEQPFDESNQLFKWMKMKEGLTISNFSMVTWTVINIVQLTIMVFIFSIMTAFPQTQDESAFIVLRVASFVLYIVDMLLNMSIQSFEKGKRVVSLWNICQKYFQNGLLIDLSSIVTFPIAISSGLYLAPVSLLVTILKLFNNIERFEKLEYLIISNEKQHYYGLIKVFLTNFIIGHFLSILLNIVAKIRPQDSWHTLIVSDASEWYSKYIWGYYWGTNIMLTVGFGDLKANNEFEAVMLIFVEIFSCIILAYNISNVGALITEIRSNSNKKKKKLKTFHRMSKDNQISQQLVTRVNNFIEQSYQIKEQFEFNQYDILLQELPGSLQSQYRKESNNFLFDNIGFLSNMSKRTLLFLAEAVNRKVAHPQEIFIKRGQSHQFMILQAGQVSMCCSNKSELLSGKPYDCIKVKEEEKPKILSLDFIKGKILNYDLVSVGYSIIYHLNRQEFANYLRKIQMDFQLFCTIRDRDQYVLGENQVYICQICKNQKHNKFDCPRLHYIPLERHAIAKYLHRQKSQKDTRKTYKRQKNVLFKQSNIKSKRKVLHDQAFRFMRDFLNERDYQQTMRVRRAYRHFLSRKQNRQNKQKIKQKIKQNNNKQEMRLMLGTNISSKSLSGRLPSEIYLQRDGDTMNSQFIQKIEQIFMRNKENFWEDDWHEEVDAVQNYRYYFTPYNIDEVANNYPIYNNEDCAVRTTRIQSLF